MKPVCAFLSAIQKYIRGVVLHIMKEQGNTIYDIWSMMYDMWRMMYDLWSMM
jgi:hypothetical protein